MMVTVVPTTLYSNSLRLKNYTLCQKDLLFETAVCPNDTEALLSACYRQIDDTVASLVSTTICLDQ